MSEDISKKVSSSVIDAWKVNPPCSNEENYYCHVMCPYYNECCPDLDFEEDL